MSEGLDSPTVFRIGSPTLGVPVLGLDYRGSAPQATVTSPQATVTMRLLNVETLTEGRLARLEATLARLVVGLTELERQIHLIEAPLPRVPWYHRLRAWLRTRWDRERARWR